jgi:hypothetical protein|tara:strand:- start:194 stop:505 length:312 start_codon:yes stop_codon:yes gene_type:complete
MTDQFRHYVNYSFGTCYCYPIEWLSILKKKYKFNPTTGAMAVDFLTKILEDPDITLFGFTHEPYAWHIKDENAIKTSLSHHNYKVEKKFFLSVIKNNIKYHSN